MRPPTARHKPQNSSSRCHHELAVADTMRLAAGHRALKAQARLLDVIESGIASFGVFAADPVPSAVALADIRAIAGRALAPAVRPRLLPVLPEDLGAAAYLNVLTAPQGDTRQAQVRPGYMAPPGTPSPPPSRSSPLSRSSTSPPSRRREQHCAG